MVYSFLAVEEGACVVLKPGINRSERLLCMRAVTGTLCVLGRYGIICGLAWGLNKRSVVFAHVSVLVCGVGYITVVGTLIMFVVGGSVCKVGVMCGLGVSDVAVVKSRSIIPPTSSAALSSTM